MSVELIKYAYVAGEVSKTFWARSDLEKYDLGLAECRNFFVDYRGGITSRPGTKLVDFVMDDDKATKFFPFLFAPSVEDTYLILFGDSYIRFVQDGAYILESEKTITNITTANPGAVTVSAHGYSTGDWVYISGVEGMTQVNGRIFEVGSTTVGTFELKDPFGNDFATSDLDAYVSGGTVARVYTISSPYAAADLDELKAYQLRDTLRLTHPDYPIHNLIRSAHTSWAISEEDFGTSAESPTGVTITPSTADFAGALFGVTAVNYDGDESLLKNIYAETSMVNYTTTAGFAEITWTAIDNTWYYNVYRSRFVDPASKLTKGEQLGFIGRAYGPSFVDPNIIPDFTVTPPDHYNPFADGAIRNINITNGGSGYGRFGGTVSVSDPTGSGFVGYPIVDSGNVVIAVKVVHGGSGYTNPTVTISGAGTGATAEAVVGGATGNNPAVATVFQQRQVYAATDNYPLTIYGSRPGLFSNFDASTIVNDGDSYEHTIESVEVTPIKHLLPTRNGLLVFSNSGIWLLHGGEGLTVTPLQASADLQTSVGCSDVPPIPIDEDILFIEGKSTTVRLFSYTELSKGYSGKDMSILSNHLFPSAKPIIRWAYARNPHYVVWAVREDGLLLSFTLVKEQNVYAWARHYTKGLVKDICVVNEDGIDVTYLMVQRRVNGRWTKFIERFAERDFATIEDAWCVDCGLSRALTYPAAQLTLSASSGSGVTVTASASVFTADDVDKVLLCGAGKAIVTAYTSGTEITVDIVHAFASIPEDDDETPLPLESGDWSLDETVTSVSGFWHLEGETLDLLVDGSVVQDVTVTDGSVSFDNPSVRVIGGLGFSCRAQTLPPTASDAIIESKRKRIVGAAARVNETRGLKIGNSLEDLYEVKDELSEIWGEPAQPNSTVQVVPIGDHWNENGQTWFVQDYPLPASLLGHVLDLEVGDDTN